MEGSAEEGGPDKSSLKLWFGCSVVRCFLGTFGKQGIEYKICFLPEDLTLV